MQVFSKAVTISQLTGDGSRPSQSQIIAALFPPMPEYYRGLIHDWPVEVKQQIAGLVAPLMGWNPEPKRVLLVGPVGSGMIATMHGVSKLAEARCLRIQITPDMLACELVRMFNQVKEEEEEEEERLLVIIEDCGFKRPQNNGSPANSLLGRYLDRLKGRNNLVVVVATHDVDTLSEDLAGRFGEVTIDLTPPQFS